MIERARGNGNDDKKNGQLNHMTIKETSKIEKKEKRQETRREGTDLR